ncbi:PAS domain-containing protein [Sphingomonas tabacisoli]|uniref:histidine kinase n=1 Tax=Sphingomonas tabacisoli TaxID=2249466 RepID=A0ABW4I021_9SPHN
MADDASRMPEIDAEAGRLSALLQAIGDAAPNLIYAKDLERRMIYVNPATVQAIGRPVEQIIGHCESEWSSDGDEAREIAAMDARVMASGGQEIVDEVFTSATGQQRVFRTAKTAMRDASGAVIGLVGVSTDVTSLRRSEEALRANEERMLFGLDAARMAAWEFDLRDGSSRRSQNAMALFGLPPEGTSDLYGLVHPDDVDRLKAAQAQAVAGGAPYDVEFRLKHPDGRMLWVAVRGQLQRDETGRPINLAGVLMDITARKHAELAAERSAAEFEALAENVSQLAWMAEPDGTVTWFNRRWYDYTGLPSGLDRDARVAAAVHPEDRERVIAHWSTSFGTGVRWEDTFRLKRADGEYRWFLSRAEPIHDARGKIVRWFGTNTDVTEQIETAEALARSEAQFRAISEAIPGMLFVSSPTAGNLHVNETFCSFTGRAREELLGDKWVDALHPDDQARAREIWAGALKAETIYMAEYRFRRADGTFRWHLVRALPMRDEAGRVTQWVGACIDIHERHMAEQELQRRVDEAIVERERALFQLHEAQKLETIGQLTGGVAHDFNNLLTPIVGSLDLLRRRLEDERSVRLIDGALASAERARTLIQRLLAFARRQTLQPRAVDPAHLVQGMRELIQRSLGPRIDFVAEVESDLPAALVDPNQLELALLNLSVNARDAMPHGGRLGWHVTQEQVAADEHPDLAPGNYIRIAVSDTGIGMDADTLARAVEPFFSTKAAGQGTGLGLSMVHGLAGQSGGAFRLESAPGQGTRATLWLPIALEKTTGTVVEPEARTAPRRARLLLVDDDEEVRFTTAESLIELGYDVVSAASAQEALETIGAGMKPDLLVTDHLMPDMTGAQLAMELRQRLPRLPVLMVTGYAQLGPEELGDFDVLPKPYRHAELALRVAELLAEEPVLQRSLS